MAWIVDGNNVAGGRNRDAVRAAALALARAERVRIVVFFDGAPPPGAAGLERLGAVEVRYTANADSAILTYLSRQARGNRLATDDADLARRARGLGAEVVGAAAFWRKHQRAGAGTPAEAAAMRVEDEIAFVNDPSNRLPDAPRRVARRRRPRPV